MRILTVFAALTFLASASTAQEKKAPSFAGGFAKIKKELDAYAQKLSRDILVARTAAQKEEATTIALRNFNAKSRPLAERALNLIQPHAKDPAAIDVLKWILQNSAESPAAAKAANLFIKHHLKDPRTQKIAAEFINAPFPWTEKIFSALSKADLPRGKKALALFQLAQVVQAKMDIPPMLESVTPVRKKLLEIRFGKDYVTQLANADSAKLEARALRLYQKVIDKYEFVRHGAFENLGAAAKRAIFAIRHLRVGKVAPEIAGEEVHGQKMTLTDYRGKIVLLVFWGNW